MIEAWPDRAILSPRQLSAVSDESAEFAEGQSAVKSGSVTRLG